MEIRGRPSWPLELGTAILALSATLLAAGRPASAQTFSVPNFVNDVLYTGAGTTAFDFTPGGILYLAEKQGRVLAFVPDGSGGYAAPQVFVDIRSVVDTSQECGLLGLAVDPDFSTNRYVYLFYSTPTPGSGGDQRVVRYTADAAGTSGSNPTVILSGLPLDAPFHNAGDIQFRPGEPSNLYITLGDDGRPSEAQGLTSYRGKILRIDKATADGLTSNPYYSTGSLTSVEARTWAVGFRNPFRFTFHPIANTPQPDVLYISENGDNTDKMSWVQAGSDGGWSPGGDNGGFLNPSDPNHRVLYTDSASHIGIAVAASGPFADGASPVIYLSNWLLSGGSIRRWRLTGADLDQIQALPADGGSPFATGLAATSLGFGPDGALYWTSSGPGPAASGFPAGRVRWVGGRPPVASFATNPAPAEGPAPLTIDFTDTSSDPDGAIQTRSWDFGDGSGASATSPTHTYGSPGVYTVTLQVTDDDGLTDSAASTVTVVAGLALTLDGEVLDGGFLDGRRLGGEVELRLYQADGTTPLPFVGGLGPDENGIAVADGEIEATVAVELTGTGVVASVGETRPGLAVERIGFEVVPGATQHTQTLTFAPSGTAIRGRVTDTRMEPAAVDIGVARSDIATLYPFATGRDYRPGSGFPATGVLHRVVSDPLGLYYIPVRDGGRYYLDVVGDTGGSDYLSTLLDFPVTPGEAADQDITVGLQSGGAACDDLSALPETPNVDYATQIQPLWSFACTGCHKPNSANGGGLDLTPANSYAALVNVASTQVPGLDLVAPGRPEESYLLEKIRCDNPQVGNRMRQGDPMDPAEQALVRDWIAQGAPMTGRPPDAGMPDLGTEDSGGADAAPPDGGTGGSPEVGAPDAGIGDAGVPARDAGGSAGAEAEDVTGGCVCAPAPSGGPGVIIGVLAGALVLVPRLRRRRPGERSKGPGSALR